MNRPSRKRNYVGIACTLHDPAIAVVDSEGRIVFAEAAERHLQYKRAFASIADDPVFVGRVLQEYAETDAEIVVAKNWSAKALRMARWGESARGVIQSIVPLGRRLSALLDLSRFVFRCQLGTSSVASEPLRYKLRYPDSPLLCNDRKLTLRHFNHHLTHAAAGCYTSPFSDAVCAVVDAYGEDSSTGFYRYEDGKITPLRRSKSGLASLGWFYAMVCVACGFDWIEGEEWKVMGMAPYGKFDQEIYARLSKMLHIDGLRICRRGMLVDSFWDEDHRHHAADLAHTGQVVFEECLEKLLINLANLGISKNLVYMGGCALNSSANGHILTRTPFERLHVYSAPADDGTALGAALLAYYQDHPYRPRDLAPYSPYLGSEMSPYVMGHEESPYMERTLRFRDDVVDKVPGVVHVNQTGRLQSVKREWNERYYLLIDEFRRMTGVPIVLNTSFNVMGKPIVNAVEDAVAVLYTTGLDALVIQDYLIEK